MKNRSNQPPNNNNGRTTYQNHGHVNMFPVNNEATNNTGIYQNVLHTD